MGILESLLVERGACSNLGANGSHSPGMLQSSKVHAKLLIIVFAREFLFRPPRLGVGLGRLRGLTLNFYAAKMPPISSRRIRLRPSKGQG
jgi:hypothetical protein